MQKPEYPCPCGGKIQWKKEKVVTDNVSCGILDVEYCQKCGEEYYPEESMKIIEEKLKEKGLWGMQRKETTFWKSGNSVVLRVPKMIADALSLKPDAKAMIYSEGKKQINC